MTDLGTMLAARVDAHTDRFAYQRAAAAFAVANVPGLVLNVGCKEDPVPLKPLSPDRVVNCDMQTYDPQLDTDFAVDALFDCARDPWPFSDDSAAMVVMGDILEHLEGEEIDDALSEARRVSAMLCLTVPHDTEADPAFADQWPRGVKHRTFFTAEDLAMAVEATDWRIVHFRTVDYVFLPVGFLMCCV